MIDAKIICDSVGERSPRLITYQLRYPKFIHGEFMTHRTFSRNASSSRAVPVSKNLEEVRSDDLRAAPMHWGAEQKGMQSGEELDERQKDIAQYEWREAAFQAARRAEFIYKANAHKSIVNRILEPFLHINVVMTSCEPGLMNFFGLRLDRAAQPEIRLLAEAMWREYQAGRPNRLQNGCWHLPFIIEEDCDAAGALKPSQVVSDNEYISNLIKISVARCARVSYFSFETGKRSTIEEDLALYDRLVGSQPLHASPAEHQATPDSLAKHFIKSGEWQFANPKLHGNLPGWIQYRKTLPGEAVAPLPEAYR